MQEVQGLRRRGGAAAMVMAICLALDGLGVTQAQAQAAAPAAATAATTATAPTAAKPYVPDARFLREGPNRKTKQVVVLSGVQSEAERLVVKDAMEDIITFVRLFGLTGSDMGDVVPKGMTAEEVAKIKASPVAHRTFQNMTTPQGRSAMPIPVASGHLAFSIDQWVVESDSALTVRVDFRQPFYEFKPVQNPVPRVLRMRFIRQDGRWLFDGAQEQAR